jgi:cellulose synthase/poly-beta-1,6-N-acetylglucosamine synthase-like glycosyltransferase
MLLRVEMLEQVGVFCETDTDGREDKALAHYHGQAHIGSERILCWKSMAAGWRTMYCNYPAVFHEAGKSWNHDLGWLNQFRLDPLWESCDTLDEPRWLTPTQDKE